MLIPNEYIQYELGFATKNSLAHFLCAGSITGRMASLSGRRDYPEILDGRRAITGDNALRLARFLGTTAEFWLNYPLRSVRKCPRSFDFMILHAIS